MAFLAAFLGVFVVSSFIALIIQSLAQRWGITDKPDLKRKIHALPTPLLGGIGVGCSIIIVLAVVSIAGFDWLPLFDSHVTLRNVLGFVLGIMILMIGGALDDIYNLKPYQQFFFPLLACIAVISSDVGVTIITNPLGGYISLSRIQSDILTLIWLMGAIYTMKFLDGLDGLCGGITFIGASIIGFFSLFIFINIPTAILSFIIAGGFAGFLLWNFYPARIFLGEAGSTLAGFCLGVLAIISGAKFATALLILAIPIIDASWVIFQRLILERRSPFCGDRKHIHFRLVDSGLSQLQAVGVLYVLSLFFGMSALFLQSSQKLTALCLISVVALILLITYWKWSAQER